MKFGNMHEIDFAFILKEKLEKEDSKHLKPSLHCGRSQMEFRATGHRAAEIQLDTGMVLVIYCC